MIGIIWEYGPLFPKPQMLNFKAVRIGDCQLQIIFLKLVFNLEKIRYFDQNMGRGWRGGRDRLV